MAAHITLKRTTRYNAPSREKKKKKLNYNLYYYYNYMYSIVPTLDILACG